MDKGAVIQKGDMSLVIKESRLAVMHERQREWPKPLGLDPMQVITLIVDAEGVFVVFVGFVVYLQLQINNTHKFSPPFVGAESNPESNPECVMISRT